MSLVIAGERSGVGKTTVTLALLSYLCKQGFLVQSFKVGPDYIDPMFHHYVTGRPCRNLDPVLTSEKYVQDCFARHTQAVEYALIEGVMGMFDGAGLSQTNWLEKQWLANSEEQSQPDDGYDRWLAHTTFASTFHIARLTNNRILLVVDCSRLSHSVFALVRGYCFVDFDRVAGVVLNRVGSDRHLELLRSALEPLNIPILGVLRRQDTIMIPDRHLGLVPTAELRNLDPLIDQLAQLAETCFDWSKLMPLLKASKVSREKVKTDQWKQLELDIDVSPHFDVQIAVAQDAAFSFYYEDNLDRLQELGAELVFWSPMNDPLPDGVQGLYFGGGFPEVFAAQLAANESARNAVRQAIAAGMPTYAECGGLMYLCQSIVDFEQKSWKMVGVLPANAVMGKQLTLGYRRVEGSDSLVFRKGTIVWGHEFHRSHLTPSLPHSLTPSLPNLHASYIHLHWGATSELPLNFLQQCQKYRERIVNSGQC